MEPTNSMPFLHVEDNDLPLFKGSDPQIFDTSHKVRKAMEDHFNPEATPTPALIETPKMTIKSLYNALTSGSSAFEVEELLAHDTSRTTKRELDAALTQKIPPATIMLILERGAIPDETSLQLAIDHDAAPFMIKAICQRVYAFEATENECHPSLEKGKSLE